MLDLGHAGPAEELRRVFATGRTRPLAWRRAQLDGVVAMGREREREIFEALRTDLGKPAFESYASEIAATRDTAVQTRQHLRRWMRARRVPLNLVNLPGRARVVPEPKGVVLIIAPWNCPYHLVLSPLIPALAAGNCAVVKPSEFAPATAALLARLLPEYLDPEAVRVIEGDAKTAEALVTQPFDHILFTGSTAVGRKVMQAAGRTLTPVTLGLGGKSPVIIARDADVETAARRVAWGKCLNAGQTSIAPDYVLAEPGMADPFIRAFALHVHRFLGDDAKSNPDYARIINRHHFDRLARMLAEGDVVVGGTHDAKALFIEPSVLRDPPAGATAMAEEIFGPILPVIEVDDLDAAIGFVNARPKPLALYLFSTARATARRVIAETSSGSVVVNDVVMQAIAPALRFGGIGASGMGAYHGRAGFDTFSHFKPVMTKPIHGEVPLRYPPYSARNFRWLRRLF